MKYGTVPAAVYGQWRERFRIHVRTSYV